ncbi:MAG: hypothetical protein MR316_09610 [Lachnospiraceae bacterium]|nr:hypothetical protein [Lachnospiraceae bacterium]
MIYQVMVNDLLWEDDLWKKFCKYAKKHCKGLMFPEKGIVEINDTAPKELSYEKNIIVKNILSEFLDKKMPLKPYVPREDSNASLPIETDVLADTYLFLSLKLAILQADAHCASALDQYFLDIILNYHKEYWHFYDFDEEVSSLLQISGIPYREIPINQICELICTTIDADQYITVHLDEYYIPRKESYMNMHLVRENLIYGYDDEKRMFQIFGFGKREQTEAFEIDYDDLLLSFEKGRMFYFAGAGYLKLDGCYPVTFIDKPSNEPFDLTEDYFLTKIRNFVCPKEPRKTTYDIQIYGSDVYEWMLEELEGKTDRETIDYRTFHLLHEHKKNIYRCMKKLKESGTYIDETILEEYKEVVRGFQMLRILYMKEAGMTERLIRTKKVYKLGEGREKICRMFQQLSEKELAVLKKLLDK